MLNAFENWRVIFGVQDIIIIFAWFIAVHQSHTIYTSLAQRKGQSKEMNNRETNENMHSNSTRVKFVIKDTTCYEKISKDIKTNDKTFN